MTDSDRQVSDTRGRQAAADPLAEPDTSPPAASGRRGRRVDLSGLSEQRVVAAQESEVTAVERIASQDIGTSEAPGTA